MLEVHVTFANAAEAHVLSRTAVERRLAACANILPAMHSFYWWDGRVRSEDEVAVVFTTADATAAALVAFVAANHSYKVPAITVHRPEAVHEPYRAWVEKEARP